MSEEIENEEVIWTPQMPDRRKSDRRAGPREFNPNAKTLNISQADRRAKSDRRKTVSVTITGRAMDVADQQL